MNIAVIGATGNTGFSFSKQAHQQGISIQRSQVRRILLAEGVRWRSVRSWASSPDPEFAKKERLLSPCTPRHLPTVPCCVWMS